MNESFNVTGAATAVAGNNSAIATAPNWATRLMDERADAHAKAGNVFSALIGPSQSDE